MPDVILERPRSRIGVRPLDARQSDVASNRHANASYHPRGPRRSSPVIAVAHQSFTSCIDQRSIKPAVVRPPDRRPAVPRRGACLGTRRAASRSASSACSSCRWSCPHGQPRSTTRSRGSAIDLRVQFQQRFVTESSVPDVSRRVGIPERTSERWEREGRLSVVCSQRPGSVICSYRW